MKKWLLILLVWASSFSAVAGAAPAEVIEGGTRYVVAVETVRMKLGQEYKVGETYKYERTGRFTIDEIKTWSKTITATPSGTVATEGGTTRKNVIRLEFLFSAASIAFVLFSMLVYWWSEEFIGLAPLVVAAIANAVLFIWSDEVLIGLPQSLALVGTMLVLAVVACFAYGLDRDKLLYSVGFLHVSLMGVYIWFL